MAQNAQIEISGKVLDAEINEAIPNVHVLIDGSSIGTLTNENGDFKLFVDKNAECRLIFYHTSFEIDTIHLQLPLKRTITVYLTEKQYVTNEITVKAHQQSIVKGNIPGKIVIKQAEVLKTPSFLGEPDLVRTLQLLPGIQSVSEGNSGIYVRGGSPGQNYIVFDGIELMNPSHLMGIYSVFNPFLVKNVDFYKGNAPIRFSPRLASSIIVTTRDRKLDNYNWAVNIGNITSNLSYQAQSKNDKWYFSTGYRRSYVEGIQYVADKFLDEEQNYFTNNKFNFYDLNGKVRYSNHGNNFALSWYKGGDYFKYNHAENQIFLNNKWGNEGVSLVWNRLLNSQISINTTLSYSGYKSDLQLGIVDQNLSFKTDYKQFQFKTDFLYQLKGNLLRFGTYYTNRYITPQNLDISLNSNEDELDSKYLHHIFELYLSNDFKLWPRLDLYLGGSVQLYNLANRSSSGFSSISSNSLDENRYLGKGLITLNYQMPNDAAIKASANYLTQNIHLTSIASIPLPSDVWMPATQQVPEEKSTQVTLGYFKAFNSIDLECGIEGYGRIQENQLVLNINMKGEEIEELEDNFFVGESKAYGAEFFLKKTSDKLGASLSYTLGWVKQRFDNLNNGRWHDAKYDRRHDVNLTCSYKLNKKIELGSVFILATGNKATLPVGRYWMMGSIANDYEGINNYRMPLYHRLDFSVNYYLESDLFKESVINFSIINVMNRSNPYFIYYDVETGVENYDLNIKARQVSLFPILPSLSWKVKF